MLSSEPSVLFWCNSCAIDLFQKTIATKLDREEEHSGKVWVVPQIPSFVDREGVLAQYIMPLLSPFIAFSNSFFTDEFLGGFYPPDTFKSNSLVFNYAALAIQTLVFLSATLFIENLRFNLKDK